MEEIGDGIENLQIEPQPTDQPQEEFGDVVDEQAVLAATILKQTPRNDAQDQGAEMDAPAESLQEAGPAEEILVDIQTTDNETQTDPMAMSKGARRRWKKRAENLSHTEESDSNDENRKQSEPARVPKKETLLPPNPKPRGFWEMLFRSYIVFICAFATIHLLLGLAIVIFGTKPLLAIEHGPYIWFGYAVLVAGGTTVSLHVSGIHNQ